MTNILKSIELHNRYNDIIKIDTTKSGEYIFYKLNEYEYFTTNNEWYELNLVNKLYGVYLKIDTHFHIMYINILNNHLDDIIITQQQDNIESNIQLSSMLALFKSFHKLTKLEAYEKSYDNISIKLMETKGLFNDFVQLKIYLPAMKRNNYEECIASNNI